MPASSSECRALDELLEHGNTGGDIGRLHSAGRLCICSRACPSMPRHVHLDKHQ